MFSQTSERFTIKNIGINTTNNEYGTVVSKQGGIYYLKSGFKGQMDLNESFAILYRGDLSEHGEIAKGLKFPTDAIHAAFTNDGQYVYFSKKVGSKFQLFKAYIDNTGRWKDEIRLPFNDLNFNFKQPALSIDNTKLFFVSDKSDSNGSTDIYYVDIKNKGLEYGEPVHLSFYVNSPGEEIFPYIGENDKIYFSSDGMGGEGGLDIYESFLSNGQYEKTANLGIPINSEFDDFAYTLTSGNSKGYFSSNRKGGKGGVDIYYFEDKKPTLNNCSQSILGFVKNKENQKPIFEAVVEVFDSNGNNENTLTDHNGQFVIKDVECDATYDIVAYKEGYNGFAEVRTNPKSNNVINLYLNPEFPDGFKEDFDLNNEMVAIDTKTNEVIIPEKNKPIENKIGIKKIDETKTVAINETKKENKVVEENYDPLDYDPYSKPKASPKKTVKEDPKKESFTQKNEVDPLDYDPYSVTPKKKEVIITKKTDPVIDSNQNKEVIADYDPLDYDPKTQSKNTPKLKAQQVNQIEEANKKTELARQERLKMIEEARITSDKLKKEEDTKNVEIAQQEAQQKADKEKQIIAQQQAVADAKKRDEKLRQDNEALAKANIEKAKQAEADRLKKEADDKARVEKERQDKLVAQQKTIEEERQKRMAEARATADKLNKEEDTKNVEIAQQEAQQKADKEKQIIAQQQAVADAKKRDEQLRQDNEALAKANIEKAKQAEADRLKKEADDKARVEKERQDKLVAQQKAIEEERQKRMAEARATADKLNKEEDTKNVEIAQQEAQQKADKEKQIIAQQQAVADAKKRDEQLRQDNEALAKANIEKAKQAEADRLKKEADDKARVEKERQDKLVAQQKAIEEERQKRMAEARATADKLNKEEDTKNVEIAEQETQQKADKEKQIIAQQQAVADAKKRDEQLRQDNEALAKANIEKAKQAEADRLKKEADDKARVEKERQDKLVAQQKAIEEERQKRMAEAKATADKLKKEEDAKNVEIAQQETQQKSDKENINVKPIEKNDIQKFHTVKKGEGLYSIAKNHNLTVEELKSLNNLKDNNISVGQKLITTKSNTLKQNNGLDIASSDVDSQKNESNRTYNTDELKDKQSRIDKANETYLKLLKEKEKIEAQNNNSLSENDSQKTENNKNIGTCAKNISGNVLNSKTRKVLPNVTVDMYFDGQNIETTTTDEKGNFNFYNVDCDTKYTLICYRENFDNIAKAMIDTKLDPKSISILLEPNENKIVVANNPIKNDITQNQVVASNKTPVTPKKTTKEDDEMTYYVEPKEIEAPKVESGKVVLNPIYFDLDEWYLTSEARRELDKIILLMKMNPTMIIESGSHTDTRGPFGYNLDLSEKRSQETVGYLVANGVDPDRISGRGYGETMPVNQCLDGVKCNENEHMQNRRTEFVILKY